MRHLHLDSHSLMFIGNLVNNLQTEYIEQSQVTFRFFFFLQLNVSCHFSEKQMKSRSRCKDSSGCRPQAFPYGHWRRHQCSCAFIYRSQQKGENAVTRDYYQLTHEIAIHRAVMERAGRERPGAVFYRLNAVPSLASKPDNQNEKKKDCKRHSHGDSRQQRSLCF